MKITYIFNCTRENWFQNWYLLFINQKLSLSFLLLNYHLLFITNQKLKLLHKISHFVLTHFTSNKFFMTKIFSRVQGEVVPACMKAEAPTGSWNIQFLQHLSQCISSYPRGWLIWSQGSCCPLAPRCWTGPHDVMLTFGGPDQSRGAWGQCWPWRHVSHPREPHCPEISCVDERLKSSTSRSSETPEKE